MMQIIESQAQRDALIERCKKYVALHESRGFIGAAEDQCALIHAIALSALEAKPVAYSYRYAGCETCEGFQDWQDELSTERPPEWMMDTGKVESLRNLYTVPPVPVLKHVNLDSADCATLPDGLYFKRDDVIEAIHQAGCTIKGE